MKTDDDAVALIDDIISAMQMLRARMASAEPEPELEAFIDDFAPCNLLELPLAAQRFEVNKSTLQRWCRENSLGVMRGGRWRVSIPRLKRRLGHPI